MSKDTYRYLVDIKDFEGTDGKTGLQVTIDSEFELTERELGSKAMKVMIEAYDKQAHQLDDKNAFQKLMNLQGLKDFRLLDSNVIAIQHEVVYECYSSEL